jgi:DNA-binding NarL/FixJ family response regulator
MPADPPTPPLGFVLTDDLMWSSRIAGTARALGMQVKAARTLDQLEAAARVQAPVCVILDLGAPGATPAEAVRRLRAIVPDVRFTAYGSHVDVAALRAARDAGCDPVLPRSKMAEELPALLDDWFRPRGDDRPLTS